MFTTNNKILNLSLAFILILGSVSNTNAATVRDVPSGHWAKGAVDEVVSEYGFMQGDPNGNFGGGRSLTRYEFAKTISRMTEYFNAEIDSDRADLENVVAVMELFQNELKIIEAKMTNIQTEVQAQNKSISEINELAITLGEGYAGIVNDESTETPATVTEARLTQLENDIGKLQNKGLFIDTLVKGTVNDVKKLGGATGRAFSSARRNITQRNAGDELEQVQEQTQTQVRNTIQEQMPSQNTDAGLYYNYDGGDLEVLQEVVE